MSQKLLKIYDGRSHFWQWDKGQRLIILDDSITTVHLSHKGEHSSKDLKIKIEDNMRICDIPDVFLQIPKNLVVYAVQTDSDCENTITAVEFAVKLRAQPDGYMSVHDNEYNDINARVTALEEASGVGIEIDGELNAISKNPIQNKVVAIEVQNIKKDISDIENEIETIKDGSGINITVDGELNADSENPVQNKVVTAKFVEVDTTIGNIDVLLETI